MVQPGKNPSPDEPFRDQNASEPSEAGLEGVVEELRNVLSGLGESTADDAAPVEKTPPPAAENTFSFSPVAPVEPIIEPLNDVDAPAHPEPSTPSDADFWNGNVLGWADKEQPGAPPLDEAPVEEIAPMEPLHDTPIPQSSKSSVEDLLPPLPPSPFDADAQPSVPYQSAPHVQEEPSPPPAPPPVFILPPEPIAAAPAPAPIPAPVPEPVKEPVMAPPIPETVETIAPPPPPITEEEPALVEIAMEKPEGLVQIACVYPKGFEKQGQNFVTTLRAACAAAKLQIVIQPVFIQPWAPDRIDIPSWTKAAYQAGADRFFVIAAKKDQALFKSVHGEAAKAGMASRIIMIEHVGLRTLYADILVELRRPA